MQFIKTFIGKSATKEMVEHLPTVEKVQEFFEYCATRNSKSAADYSHKFKYGIGSLISWHVNKLHLDPQSNSGSETPWYIKWSNHPEYAFLSVVKNEVSYYYSSTCGSEIDQCELTFDPHHIKMINELFDYYYKKFIVEGKVADTSMEL